MHQPRHLHPFAPASAPARLPVMALGLALLVLGGCAAPPAPDAAPAAPTPSRENKVQTIWRVVQARTEPMLDTRRARLDFQPGGRLVGHTSCNALSASYTLEGDKLSVGAVVTTRMACNRLLMEQEDRLLSALELAATARVRPDGLLELRDAEGRGVLRALRADLPE